MRRACGQSQSRHPILRTLQPGSPACPGLANSEMGCDTRQAGACTPVTLTPSTPNTLQLIYSGRPLCEKSLSASFITELQSDLARGDAVSVPFLLAVECPPRHSTCIFSSMLHINEDVTSCTASIAIFVATLLRSRAKLAGGQTSGSESPD